MIISHIQEYSKNMRRYLKSTLHLLYTVTACIYPTNKFSYFVLLHNYKLNPSNLQNYPPPSKFFFYTCHKQQLPMVLDLNTFSMCQYHHTSTYNTTWADNELVSYSCTGFKCVKVLYSDGKQHLWM